MNLIASSIVGGANGQNSIVKKVCADVRTAEWAMVILDQSANAAVTCGLTLNSCLTYYSSGFIISAFTYNIYVLFVTFGVMCGTAQSFLYVAGASILYFYFDDKKGLATSKDHLCEKKNNRVFPGF